MVEEDESKAATMTNPAVSHPTWKTRDCRQALSSSRSALSPGSRSTAIERVDDKKGVLAATRTDTQRRRGDYRASRVKKRRGFNFVKREEEGTDSVTYHDQCKTDRRTTSSPSFFLLTGTVLLILHPFLSLKTFIWTATNIICLI